MSTRAVTRSNILQWRESVTHETLLGAAPVAFYDDFLGAGKVVIPAAGSAESGQPWAKKIIGAAPPTVAGLADAAGGVIECALTVDAQKQDAALFMDDHRNFSLERGLAWEAWVKHSVLPTLAAESVLGLVGDWVDGPDAMVYSAFFTCDGSGEVFCEVDDAVTDQSVTSGVTVLATEWHLFRVEFHSPTDIRFYIDGNRVAAATAFSYAATGANAVLQPYLGLYKASGAGLGTIQVDNVRIYQKRS